jgi:hypothetical protein
VAYKVVGGPRDSTSPNSAVFFRVSTLSLTIRHDTSTGIDTVSIRDIAYFSLAWVRYQS